VPQCNCNPGCTLSVDNLRDGQLKQHEFLHGVGLVTLRLCVKFPELDPLNYLTILVKLVNYSINKLIYDTHNFGMTSSSMTKIRLVVEERKTHNCMSQSRRSRHGLQVIC